jgi:hypothetical protein
VFPAYRGSEGPMREVRGSFDTISKKLPYDLQAHDLRRGFATIASIVLSGDRYTVGRLIAHQSPPNMEQTRSGSEQTDDYIAKYLAAERIAANKVASSIEAIAMGLADDVLKAKLKDRGMDLDKLVLEEIEDDDTDALAEETGRPATA